MNRKDAKRIFVLLLIAAVCFAVLFSAFYIASEADHDCIGDNCTVCARLCACENLLGSLGLASVAAASVIAAVCFMLHVAENASKACCSRTLISLNVELLN